MNPDLTIGVANPVPVIDLRHEYAALVAHAHFSDYVRENAAALVPTGHVEDGIDVSCVVLVDHAAALLAHSAAFALMLSASAVKQVVCVAVGMADPESRTAVALPSVLNRESVAVLWAGDPAGIPWRLDRGPASLVQTAARSAVDDPAPLADLLEALRMREVFHRVVAETQLLQAPVTAPAVRIRTGRLDDRALATIRRQALITVATGGPGGAPPGEPRQPGRGDAAPPGVPAGGRLRERQLAAEDAVAAVAASIRAAGKPGALLTPRTGGNVPQRAAAAAAAVDEYRAALAALFGRLDSCADDQRRAELRAEGIVLPPSPAGDGGATEDISRVVQECLDGHRSLDQTVQVLNGRAARLLPMGSAARLPALDDAVAGIEPPPAMGGGFGRPLVPLLTLAAPLLPALAAPSWRYACLAAFVLLVLGALAVRGKRRHAGLDRPRPLRDLLTLLAVAALAGVGPAVAATPLTVPDPRAGLPLAATGLVLAAATPFLWWRRLVRRWHTAPAADSLGLALDRLARLYDETTGEWSVTDHRRRASNTFRTTAVAMDAIRAAFLARAQRLRPDGGEVPAQRTGDAVPAGTAAAVGAMRQDLLALVRVCMADRWAEARAGDLDGLPERAARQAEELLDELERHLRRRGVEEPPPGWPSHRDPEQLGWWHGGLRGVVFDAGRPTQLLCADYQVPMLSRDLRRAVTIRFAPKQAWAVLTGDDHQEHVDPADVAAVVWTAAGSAAGLLHLVPLRVGVHQVQTETTPGPDRAPPSGEELW